MEPGQRSDAPGRRSTDVELAELGIAFKDLAEDVGEVKRLLETNYVPRIADLESWRTQWAATELEREKNRTRQQQNAIGKRELWLAVVAILVALLGVAVTLAGLVLANT